MSKISCFRLGLYRFLKYIGCLFCPCLARFVRNARRSCSHLHNTRRLLNTTHTTAKEKIIAAFAAGELNAIT
jgi:hypothetical protein